jgi:hypothetical protein
MIVMSRSVLQHPPISVAIFVSMPMHMPAMMALMEHNIMSLMSINDNIFLVIHTLDFTDIVVDLVFDGRCFAYHRVNGRVGAVGWRIRAATAHGNRVAIVPGMVVTAAATVEVRLGIEMGQLRWC